MNRLEFSLILPCYNESEHFQDSIHRIINVVKKLHVNYEIILIDDASHDQTPALIRSFLNKHPKLPMHAYYHPQNQGRGQSVVDGIRRAKGMYVGFMDIDCEVSPEYLPQFIKKLESGYDLVYGIRRYKVEAAGLARAVASKLYSFIVALMLQTKIKDTESGYKFFRKAVIMPIVDKTQDKKWFWDTEIMVRAERDGIKIEGIPVTFKRRYDKTSTVRLIPDTIEYLRQIWHFQNTYHKHD